MVVHAGSAQLVTTEGSYIISDTTSFIVLNNVGIVSQSAQPQFENIFKFMGSKDVKVDGNHKIRFNKMIVELQDGAKVLLDQDLDIHESILFAGGFIDLNNREIHLQPGAKLLEENKSSRITGDRGGFVSIQVDAGSSPMVNPGNLGAILNSSEPIGTVSIRRGHRRQSGFSMNESIHRYYDIEFTNSHLNHASVRFKYFNEELNGQNEKTIKVYQSSDQGIHWNAQENAIVDVVVKGKANTSNRWTLSTPDKFANQTTLNSTTTLRTWPNPASSYFYTQIEGLEGDALVQVYDVNGKLHRSSNVNQGAILKIDGLLPGVYIISVTGKNLNKSNRVIIQNGGSQQVPGFIKTPSKTL